MAQKREFAKLPKGFKQKWIMALRSGKYKQNHYTLRAGPQQEPNYCVLGVAWQIAMKDKKLIPTGGGIPANTSCVPKALANNSILQSKLVNMNDQKGMKFPALADWIEENL